MKKDQEYRADALNRTRDFIGVHADAVAGLADSEGMKQLDGSIVGLAGFSNQQAAADRFIAGRVSRERALTADLIEQHMRPIATFARARDRKSVV